MPDFSPAPLDVPSGLTVRELRVPGAPEDLLGRWLQAMSRGSVGQALVLHGASARRAARDQGHGPRDDEEKRGLP